MCNIIYLPWTISCFCGMPGSAEAYIQSRDQLESRERRMLPAQVWVLESHRCLDFRSNLKLISYMGVSGVL